MSDEPISTVRLDDLRSDALVGAFSTVGAIRLMDVMDAQDCERLQRVAHEAFALPDAVRAAYRRIGVTGGYTPVGTESVRGQPVVGRDFWDLFPAAFEPHRLPDEAPSFRDALLPLFDPLTAVSLRLLSLLDEVRGVDRPRLRDVASGGRHSLRVNHYLPANQGTVVFLDHLDFGLLTISVGGSGRGFQYAHGGRWYDLENPAGSVVVHCGTTIRMFEPGFVPLRHRVCGTGVSRYSTTFFTEPRGDVVLPNGKTASAHLADMVARIRRD